ncbi:unnamed protein product [Didymodactylos carnosus]|uniref:SWIM-type domain-containing protein n=1 Tax=Didymodactylos carnosus TaxID=1234261 RepID=A0A8S2EKG3_9BILA|nr:unnamed protein product [Didymodactylos carnosus]CAF4055920.1 unnamed protein product [Didymodactylos carnosus]
MYYDASVPSTTLIFQEYERSVREKEELSNVLTDSKHIIVVSLAKNEISLFSKYLFDEFIQKSSEAANVINWCSSCAKLYAIQTDGNGNCLVDACSIALTGISDAQLTLRKTLSQYFKTNEFALRDRWKYSRNIYDSKFDIETDDHLLLAEWTQIVLTISEHRSAHLESCHIFGLRNMLERPIIVIGDEYIDMLSHKEAQLNDLVGIYFPLLSSNCHRYPLILAYKANHFSLLLPVQCHINSIASLQFPLCFWSSFESDKTLKELPIHYLHNIEEKNVNNLFKKYLNITNFQIDNKAVKSCELNSASDSENINLVNKYICYLREELTMKDANWKSLQCATRSLVRQAAELNRTECQIIRFVSGSAHVRLKNTGNQLKITVLYLQHSHEMSIDNLKFYPANRRFNNEDIEQIKHYDKHKVPRNIIRNILTDTHQDKFYTVKDIGNILNKETSNNTIAQELAVQTCLTEMKEADPTATIEVIVQGNYELNMVFTASTKMKNNFQKFGKVIFFDVTYKINLENYSLYVFLVQDNLGTGQPAALALLASESQDNIRSLLELFKATYQESNKIETFFVDKDFNESAMIEQWKETIARLPIEIKKKHEILAWAKRVMYSENEEKYQNSLCQLKLASNNTDFYKYFVHNWISCLDKWVFYERKNQLTYMNNTNNRIESFYRVVKSKFHQRNKIPHIAEALLILMSLLNFKSDIQQYQSVRQQMTVFKITNSIYSAFMTKCGELLADFACKFIYEQLMLMDKAHLTIIKNEFHENDLDIITIKNVAKSNQNDLDIITIKNVAKSKKYEIQPATQICTCYYNCTMTLPCLHILFYLKHTNALALNDAVIPARWIRQTLNQQTSENILISEINKESFDTIDVNYCDDENEEKNEILTVADKNQAV